MSKTNQLAFTLLELLVVIAIIGILVSLAAASFNNAQRKSRDARRKDDLQAVQTGLEQYYAINNSYQDGSLISLEAYIDDLTDSGNYFPAGAPVDPKNSGDYTYTIQANSSSYCICAHLESMVGNANASATTTNCSFGSGDYYCIQNLQ